MMAAPAHPSSRARSAVTVPTADLASLDRAAPTLANTTTTTTATTAAPAQTLQRARWAPIAMLVATAPRMATRCRLHRRHLCRRCRRHHHFRRYCRVPARTTVRLTRTAPAAWITFPIQAGAEVGGTTTTTSLTMSCAVPAVGGLSCRLYLLPPHRRRHQRCPRRPRPSTQPRCPLGRHHCRHRRLHRLRQLHHP